MTNHDMKLDTIYFDYILNKKKIYETRVNDPKRQKIHLLDTVTFKDRESKRTFKAVITELSYFVDFKSAIVNSGLKKILPNAKSVNEGIKLYESFKRNTLIFSINKKILNLSFILINSSIKLNVVHFIQLIWHIYQKKIKIFYLKP